MTYDELTAELQAHEWYFQEVDQSWRGPGGEPAASIEALQDVCRVYPNLVSRVLEILLAGHAFDIKFEMDGYETTIRLRPQPMLVSQDPEVFARPVKL